MSLQVGTGWSLRLEVQGLGLESDPRLVWPGVSLPRGSRYKVIQEFGLKDHDYYGLSNLVSGPSGLLGRDFQWARSRGS